MPKQQVGPSGEHVVFAVKVLAGAQGSGVFGYGLVRFASEDGEPAAGSVDVRRILASRVSCQMELRLGGLQNGSSFSVALLLDLKPGEVNENAGKFGMVLKAVGDGSGLVEQFASEVGISFEELQICIVVEGGCIVGGRVAGGVEQTQGHLEGLLGGLELAFFFWGVAEQGVCASAFGRGGGWGTSKGGEEVFGDGWPSLLDEVE